MRESFDSFCDNERWVSIIPRPKDCHGFKFTISDWQSMGWHINFIIDFAIDLGPNSMLK